MTWTAYLTYTAPGLAAADTDALRGTLATSSLVYDQTAGLLQIVLDVDADTLAAAATAALDAAAAATGLLKPTRLYVLPTTDAHEETAHPAPLTVELIGVTEIAKTLGVSRQRAGQLADRPDFPEPVAHPPSGRLYTRASVDSFKESWLPTRSPRGGRPRRQPTARSG